MRSFFFFYLFFFIFCGGGGGGSENVQEFHFAVARGGDFFFVDKFLVEI